MNPCYYWNFSIFISETRKPSRNIYPFCDSISKSTDWNWKPWVLFPV